MKREVKITADGSATISVEELDVTYHSIHGALQESKHVFLQAGLKDYLKSYNGEVAILEMGLGTGLNALLTCQYAIDHKVPIYYEAIEKYPLTKEELAQLNYAQLIEGAGAMLNTIHSTAFSQTVSINEFFTFKKVQEDLLDYHSDQLFDIIYYDAFAPTAQPELWTVEVFQKLYERLKDRGTLVTYCAKGQVRRNMQSAGFKTEQLPGPPRKREMLRAAK